MADEQIKELVQKARENSKDRNFSQSFDLIVNLTLLDLKKPENRMNEILLLPEGRGKEASVAFFADSKKNVDCEIYSSSDIERMAKDKKELRDVAKNTDFFLAEPQLMPVIGKSLGRILAPRGKMPTLATGDVKSLVKRYKKSVRIKVKDAPVIQCMVGTEEMKDEEVANNVDVVLNFLIKNLPKGRNNISRVYLKTTMGKPAKIDM